MKLQGFNELNVEENLESKLRELSIQEQKIVAEVWNSKESFTRWPKCSRLLLPGVTRPRKGFHSYPLEITKELKARKITIDRRTNGPAIMSYLLAGGERPRRKDSGHEWTIHHIYDGKFPFQQGQETLHAVTKGNHFTESAGLVAIHPIAEALADEYFYFAWQLRWEAYKRFGYDPDSIFSKKY